MKWPANVADALSLQEGVIARFQLLSAGLHDHDVRRLLRRRDLSPLWPGVYLTHTGHPTWTQRAWAACLTAWPAALTHQSALHVHLGRSGEPAADEPIHLAVAADRAPRVPDWVRLHRLRHFDARTLMNLSPPRTRIEDAVLDVAAAAPGDLDAIQRLADAVQSRRTTAGRVAEALAARTRTPRRAFLAGVLADVGSGSCSVLEHGYLTLVERPHGLPVPSRQARSPARAHYSDVRYEQYRTRIELDGRLDHDHAAARDADLERDLDGAVDVGELTVRLGWGQVFGRACRTAGKLALLLQRQGWTGHPQRCPSCPTE